MLKYTKSDTADFFSADGEKDMQLIGNSWDNVLEGEFSKSYFARLTEAVDEEYATKIVYPPKTEIYSAFKNVPYEAVKVVILGQDPYHGAGQANGMAFAVGKGVPLPPSLVNIFKEIGQYSYRLGKAGRAAFKHRSYRAPGTASVARGIRLAAIHRRGHFFACKTRNAHGIHAVGG